MDFIKWNNSMSVQVKDIDDQHKQLISYINNLHEALMLEKTDDILENVLEKLIFYTLNHFSLEEEYFLKYKYPKAENHVTMHRDFEKQLSDFTDKILSDSKMLALDMILFLRDWLVEHIMIQDKDYSEFILKNKNSK